jgi:protein O-GlcNAc transferase
MPQAQPKLTQARRAAIAVWLASLTVSACCAGQQPATALQQADAAYRAGQAAFARQDLASAQQNFEKVVRLAPALEPGHSALGLVLIRRGQLPQGIHELEAALVLRKTDSNAQTNLALAYQQTGQSKKAIPLFAALETGARVQKKTLLASVLAGYARALATVGNLNAAAAKMKAAIQVDPRDPVLHDDLGSIYAQQQQWRSAQEEFAAAIRMDGTMASAHLHLGLAMQAQGEPDALGELAQAARLAQENNVVAIEYGKALASAGQDEQAIVQFRSVLSRDPGAIDATYELALALQRSNNVPEAINLLQQVVAAQPDNALAMTNLGMALTQEQRAKDAVPVLQRAVALAPDNVTSHQDLAAAFVQLSQFADAVAELRTALKLAPDLAQLHYNLGLAYKMQDDATNAIPEFEQAEKLDPKQPEAPYALGMLYMQGGQYEGAARELKASLEMRNENGDGWATLGSVYNKLNRLPEATAALQEAIKQQPEQPDPHLTLAAVLVKQNKTAEAAEQRRQAASLMRANMNRQRAEVATHGGESLLKNGDVAGAAVQFQDALSYDAQYAYAHEGLAKCYEAQGKQAEAAAERAKITSAKP